MRYFFLAAAIICAALFCNAAEPLYTVRGELDAMRGHIQGMCVSKDAIYFSHMGGIFKLNYQGKVLKHAKTPIHTGDICFNDGKIYSAVGYYDKARRGRGCIAVFDSELNKITVHELDMPCDGITCMNGYLYFGIGPSPQKLHRINRVGRIKSDFSDEIKTFEIDYGYSTHFGPQTISNDGKNLFMCFYSPKVNFAVFNHEMKLLNCGNFNANVGFDHFIDKEGKSTFIRVKPMYKTKKKESPYFRLDFFRYIDGKMKNITSKVKK